MSTPICTVEDVKTYNGTTSNNLDPLILSLIPSCLRAIGEFCNRNFSYSPVTEYRDGNDASRMTMSNYPIVSFTSLSIDDITIPKSTGINIAGWFVPPFSRIVVLRGYKFTRGIRNCVFNFTSGYGDASGVSSADLSPWPEELKLALMMFITTRIKERDRLGIGSKSLAGESVTFVDATSGTSGSSQGIPIAARIILENYTNTVPESGL